MDMITYELAKELKEKGFPQKFNGIESFDLNIDSKILPEPKGELYLPTLSELIEACGDMFGQLIKYDPDKGHLFIAIGEHPRWEIETESKVIRTEPYSTPEEAVARLWIALNKK